MSKTKLEYMQFPLFNPMSFVRIDPVFTDEQKERVAKAIDVSSDSHLRTAAFHPTTVFNQLAIATGPTNRYQTWVLQGSEVTVTPRRLFSFRENHKCVCCGRAGQFFIAERHLNDEQNHVYMNLYGIDNSSALVMMTVDHILPDSYGGRYHDSNFQTMCQPCNGKKRNEMTNTEIELVLLNLKDHVKDWVDIKFITAVLHLHMAMNETDNAATRHNLTHSLARYRKLISAATKPERIKAATAEIEKMLAKHYAPKPSTFEMWFDSIIARIVQTFSWAR